jgi:hypothetical protein
MAHVIILDPNVMAPFEIGARLDALLCYSTWSMDRQQEIADAICADLFAQWIQIEPHRRAELYEARSQYRKSKKRASLAKLHDRREQVAEAGRAFLPLLKQAATGRLPIFNGEPGAFSMAQIARIIWPPREGGFEEHHLSRLHDNMKALRSLRPIAHLAAAHQYVARERSGAEQAAFFDYQDLDFHREVVMRASYFADLFRSIPALGKIASGLVKIEWRE